MILGVDANANDIAQNPVIRQRLRPERIDLESRRLNRVHARRGFDRSLPYAESDDRERE